MKVESGNNGKSFEQKATKNGNGMKRIIALFSLCLAANCSAQLAVFEAATFGAGDPPAPQVYYPTNVSGSYTFYEAEAGVASAAGQWTWTNLAATGSALNLTNQSAGTGTHGTVETNAKGAYDAIVFDGVDDYAVANSYTSAQPHEVWMVVNVPVVTNVAPFLFDGRDFGIAARNLAYFDPALQLYAGATVGASYQIATNAWYVLRFSFAWPTTLVTTNGDAGVIYNGNAGADPIEGFRLASSGPSHPSQALTFGRMKVLSVATFTNVLDATAASNVFNWYTNRYEL